jgi:hypothetical protein
VRAHSKLDGDGFSIFGPIAKMSSRSTLVASLLLHHTSRHIVVDEWTVLFEIALL